MRSENDVPAGVTKVVEGVPFCPNCNVGMEPIASVPINDRPTEPATAPDDLSLKERLDAIREAEHEVAAQESVMDRAKKAYAEAKKVFDGKVATLRTLIERLTAVPGPRPPLLELAEGAESADGSLPPALDLATRLATEDLRKQLGSWYVVVDEPTIAAWTLEEYNAVIAYLSALEAAETGEAAEAVVRPAFLPEEVPDHVQALHSVMGQCNVPVPLDEVCSWSVDQRTEARAWGVTYIDGEDGERPAFIPAPLEKPSKSARKRKAAQRRAAEPEPEPAHV